VRRAPTGGNRSAARDRHDLSSGRAPVGGRGRTPAGRLVAQYGRALSGAGGRPAIRLPVFTPSSIAAFGPSTPTENTPQDTVQRPTSIYGVTKVAGELRADYYATRFGVDTRGLRLPGLISHESKPGGGTTDYAVEIFYQAIRYRYYACFLGPDTRIDMMYMPDAIRPMIMYMPDAIRPMIELMQAAPGRLEHRNAFNVAAMNFTPDGLAAVIRAHIPEFQIEYEIDPVRQKIAES
jgi:nucleoside-diphosphate-sugar epimerase